MSKKGFTLIELLAVIIILGVLMIIAIPSVTKYIEESRKSGYISTAKEIAGGARNLVYSGSLNLDDFDTTYYIDASCISTDNGYKSPYGDFTKAYVVVTATNDNYEYYWTSVDDAGRGVKKLININKLDSDNIETDVEANDISTLRTIDGRGKVVLVTKENNCQKESTITENLIQIDGETGEEDKRAITIISTKSGLAKLAGANRYVGQNPNNFVRFNGDELWRIIGIYGNSLKIMKYNNPIKNIAYDSVASSSSSWEQSTIREYLNGTYYNSLTDTAKNMIRDDGSWYVGGTLIDANASTSFEQSKLVTWIGKVGLIAPYEMLYASNDTSCYDIAGDDYIECGNESKNWMNNNNTHWTLAVAKNYTRYAHRINQGKYVYSIGVASLVNAFPVVYLKSSTKIISGTGTSIDPYILG